MCGIVGLHFKTDTMTGQLGGLLSSMLGSMTSRGPDSAGVAIYDDDLPAGHTRYSLRSPEEQDWAELTESLAAELGTAVDARHYGEGTVLISSADAPTFLETIATVAPAVHVVGYGQAMEVYKEVGAPADVSARYTLEQRRGYQGVGHTRMATESAVTTDHSHPFAADADLCLVHNGSFSNYATVRRQLAATGIDFETDNDSEVAARYIAEQIRAGANLGDALKMVLKDLDGFFTLLVATRTEFAIVRDPFACKPAVVAETDDYVAMASEYHALAGLPGIADAVVFEPGPEEVYLWSR